MQWRGTIPLTLTTSAYQRALLDGDHRPPAPHELHHLTPGDQGTVGDLLNSDQHGHRYLIHWDTGTESDITLPSPHIQLLDQPTTGTTSTASASPRYAATGRGGRLAAVLARLNHRPA